jgi:hypothetical protein
LQYFLIEASLFLNEFLINLHLVAVSEDKENVFRLKGFNELLDCLAGTDLSYVHSVISGFEHNQDNINVLFM